MELLKQRPLPFNATLSNVLGDSQPILSYTNGIKYHDPITIQAEASVRVSMVPE